MTCEAKWEVMKQGHWMQMGKEYCKAGDIEGDRQTKLSKTTIHHSMTYETKMDDEIKGTRTWNLKWDSKE